MGKCDVIKTFFLGYRRIEPRIMARVEERERYWELAIRITPAYTGMPSGGGDGSKVENGATMMMSVIDDLDMEIASLKYYRKLARRIISMTGDQRYADVLTYRYFNGYKWEKIMEAMHYENTQVWRIHGFALSAARRAAEAICADEPAAEAVFKRIQDGMERNTPPVL